MNFSPHHQFAGCSALERAIEAARAAGRVPDSVYEGYERYHFSIIHKLKSARYHTTTLQNYLASAGGAHRAEPIELVYRVNFHFDGFLHVLGSSMDIFSREVLTYFGIPLTTKVYSWTAKNRLRHLRAGDQVIPVLDYGSWEPEFREYRNTATHESLIGTNYQKEFEVRGAVSHSRYKFPIPDDPRSNARTYRHNPDIVEYCKTTFRRVLSHYNQTYNHLTPRIRAAASLPL